VTATGHDLPRLRSEVVLGPALRSGPRTVHHVKDPRTGRFYRVGPREHFIMRLMDGEHTIQDIGQAYRGTYGRVLGQDSWQQMFTLLGRYQLLDGWADEAALERIRAEHAAKQAGPDRWYNRRWVLARPDRLCADLARRFAFAFHPLFVVSALLVAVAVQVVVWTHAGALASDATRHRSWLTTVPVTLVLAWLLVSLHELAHGVTCRRFGGQVTEIGVRWRLPTPAPYCRTDDIVLFHRRTARVGTAFAGTFVTLLALVPVAVWCWLSPGGGTSRSLSAGLLLFASGGALMSLLPFFGLDGYMMLTHALNLADLRRETQRYWRLRLTGKRQELAGYTARDTWAYQVYGVVSVVVPAGGYCGLLWLWYGRMSGWIGSPAAIAVLAAETAVLVVLIVGTIRARSARTPAAGAGEARDA
jgi:putative peptide zinc metalloprotease protein